MAAGVDRDVGCTYRNGLLIVGARVGTSTAGRVASPTQEVKLKDTGGEIKDTGGEITTTGGYIKDTMVLLKSLKLVTLIKSLFCIDGGMGPPYVNLFIY